MISARAHRHPLTVALCLLVSAIPYCAIPSSAQLSAQAAPVAQPAPITQPAPATPLTEDALRSRLTDKTWYLRGRWLSDSLHFSMRGELLDHSDTGSYTLSLVRIDRVHLTGKHLELEGTRYALHFLGALPYEDPQKSSEEIRITPRKKLLRITIDRQPVVKPKKSRHGKPATTTTPATSAATANPSDANHLAASQPELNPPSQTTPTHSADSTDSPTVAARTLNHALDRILAPSLDEGMLRSLPDDWQLYYAARRSGHDFLPAGVLPAVDHPARLLHVLDPPSNSYAQANGIAGRALYRVLVSPSGKAERVAILRPIGFGLDENAVAAIKAASFAPATKSGQPVVEALDLAVLFRIYSKRTDTAGKTVPNPSQTESPKPSLPGPYSIH